MKITIIGAGNIGGTLGMKWAKAGRQVCFGVRNPADSKFDELRSFGQMIPVEESLVDADVVLLSLPGEAVAEFAAQYGASLTGKIIIDATNNIRSAEMNNLAVLKQHVPDGHLVRAFSTLGWVNFANPQIGGVTLDLFYCGHAPSRPVAEQLIEEIGLRPIYLGDLDAAATVDGLTRLWFTLAFGQGRGQRIAFKLLEEAAK